MKTIATKSEFLERSSLGLLGNHPHYWSTPDEARAAGHTGEVAIRYRRKDSPFCRFNVPLDTAEETIEEFRSRGAEPSLIYMNEMEFGANRTFQGEAYRAPGGLYLNYTTSPGGMRTALERDGHHASGLAALMLLRRYLDPNSYDDLMTLLDEYDGAVIEFTAFDGEVGALPGRRSLIWEVRSY